jgi:hypothetical protein
LQKAEVDFAPPPTTLRNPISKKDERASMEPFVRLLARVRLASDSRRIIALQRNDATCHKRAMRGAPDALNTAP